MAYFNNATEGEIFVNSHCIHCINYKDGMCPVWCVHVTFNAEQRGNVSLRDALNYLIHRKGKLLVCDMEASDEA